METANTIGRVIIHGSPTPVIMSQKSKYSQLLKDPRWQRRRLEILQRDEWKCSRCGDSTKELHVHHRSYERGKQPWEYPDSNLVTFCMDCHEREHEDEEEGRNFVEWYQHENERVEGFFGKYSHLISFPNGSVCDERTKPGTIYGLQDGVNDDGCFRCDDLDGAGCTPGPSEGSVLYPLKEAMREGGSVIWHLLRFGEIIKSKI